MTDKELIDFGVYLTGHDHNTIAQMLNDYQRGRSISKDVECSFSTKKAATKRPFQIQHLNHLRGE